VYAAFDWRKHGLPAALATFGFPAHACLAEAACDRAPCLPAGEGYRAPGCVIRLSAGSTGSPMHQHVRYAMRHVLFSCSASTQLSALMLVLSQGLRTREQWETQPRGLAGPSPKSAAGHSMSERQADMQERGTNDANPRMSIPALVGRFAVCRTFKP